MIEGYSDYQLEQFDKMVDDTILGIFNNKDKRYWLIRMIKRAYDFGYNECDDEKTRDVNVVNSIPQKSVQNDEVNNGDWYKIKGIVIMYGKAKYKFYRLKDVYKFFLWWREFWGGWAMTTKKEKKFEKIVEWKDDRGYGEFILLIILFPIFAPVFYIKKFCEIYNENRKVYWREIKWNSYL